MKVTSLFHQTSRGFPVWALVFAGILIGCGSGEYHDRMDETVKQFKRTDKFNQLKPPAEATQLAGGTISIRVPKVFKDSFDEFSRPDNAPINPDRLQPPFVKLPGFALSYEIILRVESPRVEMPVYCYLAVIETAPAALGQETPEQAILTALSRAFPESKPAWSEPILCDTDEGPADGKVSWKKVAVSGEQFFDQKDVNTNLDSYKKFPGLFELWLHQTPDFTVLLGWRIPDDMKTAFPLDSLAMQTAGTLKIKQPGEWVNDPAAASNLGEEVSIGTARMRVPKGYKQGPLPPTAGAIGHGFSAPDQPPGSPPYFGAMMMPPVAGPVRSLEQQMSAPRKLVSGMLTNAAATAVEHGQIGGTRFVRTRVSGTTAQGQAMQGIIYLGSDGKNTFVIYGIGKTAEDAKTLEAAAISFRKGG